MKTTEVNESLIGKRCECVSFGSRVTGRITSIEEDEYCVRVNIRLDTPQRWGADLYTEECNWARKCDEYGSLGYLGILPEPKDYRTVGGLKPFSIDEIRCIHHLAIQSRSHFRSISQ